jgi:tetratricopeptide (TPR) repeat protein
MDDEQGALQNYTKAIELKPDSLDYYPYLGNLYRRLGMLDQSEQVFKQALEFAKEGDKHLTSVHTGLGNVYEARQKWNEAVGEYEKAKKACGNCDQPDQKIVYFNLGGAYDKAGRKNEAHSQLQSFWKVTCKGGQAAKYADECAQAQEIAKKNGNPLN